MRVTALCGGAGTLFGDPLYIHRQSSYLFGREHRVVDVPTDHPSCSKQHAVLQYRCAGLPALRAGRLSLRRRQSAGLVSCAG